MSSSPNPAIRRVGDPQNRQPYLNFKAKKPSYLERLPFWKKYPKAVIFGGGVLTFCITFSAPIYYFFRAPPEHINPYSTMWPGEIAAGKTYKQQWLEKQERLKQERESKERQRAEAKATAESNKTA